MTIRLALEADARLSGVVGTDADVTLRQVCRRTVWTLAFCPNEGGNDGSHKEEDTGTQTQDRRPVTAGKTVVRLGRESAAGRHAQRGVDLPGRSLAPHLEERRT